MKPLISVLIPCYKQANVVGCAIKSVLAQDYENLEIIVADDCSPDNTAEVVAPFLTDPRVRYERAAKNLGRVANYRRGLMELARGEWYINLDGDDYFDNPRYISAAMSMAQERSDSVLVFGRQKYQDSSTGYIETKSPPKVQSWTEGKEFLLSYFKINEGIPHMSALYRIAIARKAELFINDIVFADAEAMLRLLPWGWIGYCGEFSGVWVYHGTNDSHQLALDLRLNNLRFITQPARSFVAKGFLSEVEARLWEQYGLTRIIREGLHFYLDQRAYSKAFQFWSRATQNWNWGDKIVVWFQWRVLVRLLFPWFAQLKTLLKKAL